MLGPAGMNDLVVNSFILLIVVIDPIGVAPMFAAITHWSTPAEQRRMAIRGVLVAGAILVAFTLAGNALLRYLGVGMPAFGIAGGILLFLLAVEMVFARQSGLRTATRAEQQEAEHRHDISVFPLAVPMIAGPGSMTTLLLLVGDRGWSWNMLVVIAVLGGVLGLTLLMLLGAARLTALLGETGANVITRVLGVVLAALAVQYVIDGVRQLLSLPA